MQWDNKTRLFFYFIRCDSIILKSLETKVEKKEQRYSFEWKE